MADVKLTQVRKSFGNIEVIRGVDLDIQHGEFVVFVGPSGCGKSTLLRAISGLEDITSGELRIGDQLMNHVDPSKRGIAMVFQSYALYPHMTVRENMGFALKHAGVAKADVASKVEAAANILGLGPLMERKPKALSGGQRQRVAIGRAIVRKPRLFLFDEPLSNLDAALRAKTRIELARLHRELGATMVYVTHDQVEAMTLGDKIVVLSDGQVQQAGTPLELYQQPANRFVATFIGSPTINLLPAKVLEARADGVRLQLADGSQVLALVDGTGLGMGESVEVGLRAEHCRVDGAAPDPQDTALHAQITLVEHLGESNLLYLRTDNEQELIVRGDGNAAVRLGDAVIVRARPESLYLFRADGRALPRLKPGNMRSAHVH